MSRKKVPLQPAPRRRGVAFYGKALLANVFMFVLALMAGEFACRYWREGGVLAALRSLADDRAMPSDLGTHDWLEKDSLRGYVLRAGVHGTNELHVRHGPIAKPEPASEFRLLVLGDSVAFPADGFVARIRDACKQSGAMTTIVVNAATPGYTTSQERSHLDAICAAIEPDAVLLQYCCNDNHRFLHQLTDDGAWLITQEARRALLPEGDGLLLGIARWSYLAFEARRILLGNRPKDRVFPWRDDPAFAAAWREDSWLLVRQEIEAMRERASAASAKFAVVAVPFEPQLSLETLGLFEKEALMPQRMLKSICSDAGIPLLDLHATFEASQDDALYTDGIHLSERGHEVAARALLPFLRSQGLLP